MKEPIEIEFAKVFIQPSVGSQGLPMLVLRFPRGTVSFDLSKHKRGRISKLSNTAREQAGGKQR